ncbi:hypothetical protein MtrunA17_Chr4g0006571 [Medicago truncatula]|nr:hypothetical protein MtrunA17_Chr4g0006571 [Medicago truncatula]
MLFENSGEDGLNAEENIDVDAHSSSPPNVDIVEDCNHVLEDVQSKDADESMEAMLSSDDVMMRLKLKDIAIYLKKA